MSSDDKIKSFLSDLGRATLRGVRRCPKCGTYNGTRGLSCKKCSCLFKERRKFNTEACKLITGNSTQIYSVRVHDKGPDYRGFVQLPLIQGKILSQDSESFVLSETALCFVDSCQRLFDTSILKCHETDQCLVTPMCQHIEAAVKCSNEATRVELKPEFVNLLNENDELKQEMYQLSQSTGPLVQRVSKNIMAVKCQVSPKHPLGYLHFSFFIPKVKEKSEKKFYCACGAENKGQNKNCNEGPTDKKCVHYYLCICGVASDPKLAEEFCTFLNNEETIKMPIITDNKKLDPSFDHFISGLSTESQLTISDNQLVSILDNDLVNPADVCSIEVEVLNDNALLDVPNISISEVMDSNVQVQNLEINENGEVTIIRSMNEETLHFSDLGDNLCLTDPVSLTPQLEIIPIKKAKVDYVPKPPRQPKIKKPNNTINNESKKLRRTSLKNQDSSTIEEKETQLSFIEWLASVTERINQTMHYQFDGKPDALSFYIPQVFFDCLRERISCGGTKKRLPNFTKAFIRRESIPLGTFTRYTWHITNILHLKQIFETPLVPLEVTRSFIQNRDGTFDPYIPKGDENDDLKKDGLIPIKPLELKTYLNVGNTSPNQIEPKPFIIEWVPDILPVSKVGELRIKFEYGHQKGNGTKLVRIPKKPNSTFIN